MAFSSAVVFQGTTLAIFSVIASADADTGGNVTHGLVNPGAVAVTPLKSWIQAILQAPAALSLWAITVVNTTLVTLVKATTASSGNAAAQIKLYVEIPNTLCQ